MIYKHIQAPKHQHAMRKKRIRGRKQHPGALRSAHDRAALGSTVRKIETARHNAAAQTATVPYRATADGFRPSLGSSCEQTLDEKSPAKHRRAGGQGGRLGEAVSGAGLEGWGG